MEARYVGGPLHGQVATKTGPSRLSIFRDDEGHTIRASVGDREWCSGSKPTRYYTHQQLPGGERLYIHASAWDAWNTSGQPADPDWRP